MSTMYRRQPGRYCGPHKQPCMNRPQPYPYFVDDIYEVKPPPDGEFDWIDGVNTFVDKDKTQGFQHLEQFGETVDKASEDTSCSPDDPDWYYFDDSTCLKIVGAPGMNFEDGLAECKKQGGKLWEIEGELNNKKEFIDSKVFPDKKRKKLKKINGNEGCNSKKTRLRLINHPKGDGDMKQTCYHYFGLLNAKINFMDCTQERCMFCHKNGKNGTIFILHFKSGQ